MKYILIKDGDVIAVVDSEPKINLFIDEKKYRVKSSNISHLIDGVIYTDVYLYGDGNYMGGEQLRIIKNINNYVKKINRNKKIDSLIEK